MAKPLSYMLKTGRAIPQYRSLRFSETETPWSYVVTGDCSASTMWQNNFWPTVEENSLPLEPTFTNPDYLYHLNNRTKIIAILRNPVARLYSDYIFFDRTDTKGPHEFHQDVVKGIEYFNDCLETYSVRSCVYSAPSEATKKVPVRLHIGIYFIHLIDWYRVFPRDQLLVLRLEDYTRHRAQSVNKIYDFLDLRNLTAQGESGYFERAINRWGHANARPDYKNMTLFEETRYLLYTFYKPFNQALARVMNDPNFDYGPY